MFRITIRDLLLATVIVALAVWWRIDHQRINKAVAEITQQALKDEHRPTIACRSASENSEAIILLIARVDRRERLPQYPR